MGTENFAPCGNGEGRREGVRERSHACVFAIDGAIARAIFGGVRGNRAVHNRLRKGALCRPTRLVARPHHRCQPRIRQDFNAPTRMPVRHATSAPPSAADAIPPNRNDAERASDSLLINGSTNNGAASAFSQSNAFGNLTVVEPAAFTTGAWRSLSITPR